MNRTNLWLLILLVFQVSFFGILVAFCGQTGSEKAERVLLLQGMPRDEINQITLEDAEGKSLVLSRSDDEWKLSSRSDYPAEPSKVSRLLAKLFGLESSYVVSTGTEHHHKLEVAEDKYRRKVTLEAGTNKQVLFWGSINPDNFVSVRQQAQPKVYAVDGIREWDLGVQISDWAKNPYFEVESDRVAGFELKRGSLKMMLRRTHLDKWMLGGKPVDHSKVNGWLDAVSKIQLSDVVGKLSDSTVLDKMKKKKHQMVVTLLVVPKPLKSTTQDEPAVEKGDEKKSQTDEMSASSSGQIKDFERHESPGEPERKVFRIAAGPEEDQQVLVYLEGESYLVQVDRWRMRELLEAGPKKLAQKAP